MKRIGLVIHPIKDEAKQVAQLLRDIASQRGITVEDASESLDAEVVFALGGDGTILRAAAVAVERDVPLLGINLGHLGYLSTAKSDDLPAVLERVAADDLPIESRMMLLATAVAGGKTIETVALNEIVVEKASAARVIDIGVTVNGVRVATYTADGFIVATPTGSTAYSLSAGGPIIEPSFDSIVLTPVSAHSPLWRSIVVAPTSIVDLKALRGEAVVSSDGQTLCSLAESESVQVSMHARKLKLVRLSGFDFFARVRARFRIEAPRVEE